MAWRKAVRGAPYRELLLQRNAPRPMGDGNIEQDWFSDPCVWRRDLFACTHPEPVRMGECQNSKQAKQASVGGSCRARAERRKRRMKEKETARGNTRGREPNTMRATIRAADEG